MAKEPETVEAFLAQCEQARGADRRLDQHVDHVKDTIITVASSEEPQQHARRLAEDLALALDASLIVQHSPAFIADAFCAARLDQHCRGAYGTLPAGIDTNAIIARALPA